MKHFNSKHLTGKPCFLPPVTLSLLVVRRLLPGRTTVIVPFYLKQQPKQFDGFTSYCFTRLTAPGHSNFPLCFQIVSM